MSNPQDPHGYGTDPGAVRPVWSPPSASGPLPTAATGAAGATGAQAAAPFAAGTAPGAAGTAGTAGTDGQQAAGTGAPGKHRTLVAIDEAADEHKKIARSRGWDFFDLDARGSALEEEVYTLLEPKMVRRHLAVPVQATDNKVTVVVSNPDDLPRAGELRPLFGQRTMTLAYANPAAIRRHIEKFYSATAEASLIGQEQNRARALSTVASAAVASGGNAGRIEGGEGANVSMMRLILEQAIAEGASDVHIEPAEDCLEVRYRVDGKLRVVRQLPSTTEEGLMTYIKVQSRMKNDNFLVPDSGVMYYKPDVGKPIDIRVETSPTAFGTSAVMRLQSEIWRPLDSLGFSDYNLARFKHTLAQPYGIILLTGPTGSGKSTTLYSSLRELIDPALKLITLENPVEFKISSGVSQISVSDEQGMTFERGLRSILRQDPDVVMVGEIRDGETAETAVDAAMTGHLVLSTLHTNDAPGVVPRLLRMGIEPFMLASSLLCVVAQRLVRRLCLECRVEYVPTAETFTAMKFDVPDELPAVMYEPDPDGCEACVGGFKGRVPIHEVMVSNDELAQAIADNAPFVEIRAAARNAGMRSLREDGLEKALEGLTSLAEVNGSTRVELA